MKKEIIFEVIMVIALIGICNALPAGPGSPSLPSDTSYVNLRIISPNDNYQTSINNVNFTFDASSDSGLIDRCELIVNNNVVKSENNLNGSKINYISYTLSNGESSWKIKCYSGDAVNESLSRSINIGSSCSNSCDNNGERICSGNGFKSCGDLNNDGCLEWSVITGCGSNQQCVSGSCVNNLPACTENDWSSSVSPSSCPQNSQQLRTWTLIGNCAGGIFHSNENITCSTQSSCTSFTYSSWSVCSSSGVQTRTVSSSSPGGCSGGNPILSQQCSYIPSCVENDWRASLNPLTCPLSNTQTKTWTLIGNCSGGVQKTTESVSCNSQSVTCTNFTYSDYSECSLSNVQTREVLLRFPANCTGGNLVISSSCSYNDYLKRIIGFNSNINSENVSLLKENAPIIEFKKIKNPGENLANILIKDGRANGKYFLIVQKGVASDSKKIYFNLSSISKGICIRDEDISDLSDIKEKCVYIDCPGNKGEYICSREIDGRFSVSGLKHSGILEVQENKCSDGICSDSEDCSNCPSDCGECTRINPPSSGRVYTNMGSSRSSSTNPNTNVATRNSTTKTVNKTGSKSSNVDNVFNKADDANLSSNNKIWIFFGFIMVVVLIVIILIIVLVLFRKKKDVQVINTS